MIQPIWKDKIVTIQEPLASLSYEVHLDNVSGELLYKGKAYKRPNEVDFNIRLNEVVADYLENALPTLNNMEMSYDKTAQDVVVVYVNSQGLSVTTDPITFLNDWSYDYNRNIEAQGISAPIRSRLQAGQFFLGSHLPSLEFPIIISDAEGQVIEETLEDYDEVATLCIDLGEYPQAATLYYGNDKVYSIEPRCHRFILHYVNAYGGWDSLIMEGNYKEEDALTRHTYIKDYDNQMPTGRGKDNFANELVKTYTLNTGWLSDDEASRMHHLLNSTMVYMWDAEKEEMLPVVLTSSTTEYKTFKTEVGMVNYQLQVEVAHNIERR